jgi:hypothetical protein
MESTPTSRIPTEPNERSERSRHRRRFRGQGVVEFALILPVLLLVIFMIVELARVLHAYLAIENGVRFAVRYAVTGEYNPIYCVDGPDPGSVACDGNGQRAEEDAAREPSIEDVAAGASASVMRDWNSVLHLSGLAPSTPAFFNVEVCSSRDADGVGGPDYILWPSDQGTFTPADCAPNEDAGGPGDRVSVTIDFQHPLIAPLISSVWPQLHLVAKREGIIEQFRTARVVGLPATIGAPTFTWTPSPTPTETLTPSDTPSPTETPTPSDTPTPTATFTMTSTLTPSLTPTTTASATASLTPTVSPTPDCSLIYSTNIYIVGDDIRVDVRNDNPMAFTFLGGSVSWTSLAPSMYADFSSYGGSTYWNGTDYTSPTSGSASINHGGSSTRTQTSPACRPADCGLVQRRPTTTDAR